MLLGIVLHGLISFIPSMGEMWPGHDMYPSDAYAVALDVIHGFRMPLFFLVSGFFTAMMWRSRGLRDMFTHRCKRIVIPTLVFLTVLTPMMIAVSIYGEIKKELAVRAKQSVESIIPATSSSEESELVTAIRGADIGVVERLIVEGADLNTRSNSGITPLASAAMLGQVDMVELLLESGAKVNGINNNGDTALHVAAFLGEATVAKILIENGADIGIKNFDNGTPYQSTQIDWETAKEGLTSLNIPVEPEKVAAGREELAPLLAPKVGLETQGLSRAEEVPYESLEKGLPRISPIIDQLPGWLAITVWILCFSPGFLHLWFLYYLMWLVAGFCVVAWAAEKLKWKTVPAWFVTSPVRLLWLIPAVFVPQFFMANSFGSDTAPGLVPWPPKLLYYTVFFGYGAVCFGQDQFEQKVGKFWPLCLAAAVPMFLLGTYWLDVRKGIHAVGEGDFLLSHILCTGFTVAYTWLAIFGLIGLFRAFCSGETPWIRYLSDSSYWLYLMHVPIVIFLQVYVSDMAYPSFMKFSGICILSTALLLALYETMVRYTWIGFMLNGKKTRKPPPSPPPRIPI